MESDAAIEVHDLHYAYKNRPALIGTTFRVEKQTIHGFVGPNGAGKTTTLKILATLLRPQRGGAAVLGNDVVRHYKAVRRRIGYMPENFSMYRQMTVFEYLDFFGAAYGMGTVERTKTIEEVLALTDMTGRQNDLIKGLSRGMSQRVTLARVLVHDPTVLLLDEPASGLDPRGRIELMEILKELRRMGKTVFISSHILTELTTLCDSITIIDRGRIKYSGEMSTLVAPQGGVVQYLLTLREPSDPTETALKTLAGVGEVRKLDDVPEYLITFDRETLSTNDMLAAVIAAGGRVVSLKENVRHLNEAFMDLTEPGVPA